MRWRHPQRGMISPAEFIPIAEDTGLINQLGEWVLTTACMEAASWPDNIRLAVNVSPVQFKSGTLALKVIAALAASGLAASRLELEITEAVLIRDDDAALAVLHQLRAIGVRIALDDFGTGYSSLSYLQRFPFDKIKIDRCFITDIAEPEGSSSIVRGGGQHRRRSPHDDDRRRRRDRAAARPAARTRLFGNAGLSVQPAEAGGRYQAAAVCGSAGPRRDTAEPGEPAQAGGADGVGTFAFFAYDCATVIASEATLSRQDSRHTREGGYPVRRGLTIPPLASPQYWIVRLVDDDG